MQCRSQTNNYCCNSDYWHLVVFATVSTVSSFSFRSEAAPPVIDPATVCQGEVLFGVTGTARCVLEGVSTQANESDILSGQACWRTDGTVVYGTMPARGAWDVRTVFPGSGYYDGITNTPAPADVCAGSTIFGVTGASSCSSYASLFASAMLRDASSSQISLSSQPAGTEPLPAGYRVVPSILKDDDGSQMNGNDSNGNPRKVVRGTNVWNTGVGRKVCGKKEAGNSLDSIAAKISDCDSQHATKPNWDAGLAGRVSWNGVVKGFRAEGSWTLVTVYSATLSNGSICDASCNELWRDDSTGLIWSDSMGTTNWCRASGNMELGASTGTDISSSDAGIQDCGDAAPLSPTYTNFAYQESWCAEVSGLTTPAANDPMKGGLRLSTTPALMWHLPTAADWRRAELNGIRFVVRLPASTYWTSSVVSLNRNEAFYYTSGGGYINYYGRFYPTFAAVRCVAK